MLAQFFNDLYLAGEEFYLRTYVHSFKGCQLHHAWLELYGERIAASTSRSNFLFNHKEKPLSGRLWEKNIPF